MFVDGDPLRPIVMGLMFQPDIHSRSVSPPSRKVKREPLQVEMDGETLRLSAEKEIVLHCGKASICLTRAGKILIRGAYLLNRSTGVNRIKGGSVQIN